MKNFNTISELLPYQESAVEKLRHIRVGALFADMGTGKSRMAIELAKIRAEKISRVVWLCPVSLKLTMKHEILKHTDSAVNDVYVFDNKTTEESIPLDKSWYIVGIESLSSSRRVVFALRAIADTAAMIICDESTYIKNPQAKRTSRIDQLCEDCKYRLVMTGTPLTNGEQDLYSQMHFLSPLILGYRSFYSFAKNHLQYSEIYPGRVVKVHNRHFLAAKMSPYTYQITKGECLKLPDKLHETRFCLLTPQQLDACEQAKDEFLDLNAPEDWTSIELFRLFTALQSIVCGFWHHVKYERVYDNVLRKYVKEKRGEEFIRFKHDRLNALMGTVAEIPPTAKVVIWAKFRHSIDEISAALKEEYGESSVALYHGGLSERGRAEQLKKFDESARFLVGTQSAGGHGLTLVKAHHMIFYANGFKFSERLQAEDRCHRIGQTMPVTYIDVVSDSSIDNRIQKALERKSNALLDFRREITILRGASGGNEKLRELVKKL